MISLLGYVTITNRRGSRCPSMRSQHGRQAKIASPRLVRLVLFTVGCMRWGLLQQFWYYWVELRCCSELPDRTPFPRQPGLGSPTTRRSSADRSSSRCGASPPVAPAWWQSEGPVRMRRCGPPPMGSPGPGSLTTRRSSAGVRPRQCGASPSVAQA